MGSLGHAPVDVDVEPVIMFHPDDAHRVPTKIQHAGHSLGGLFAAIRQIPADHTGAGAAILACSVYGVGSQGNKALVLVEPRDLEGLSGQRDLDHDQMASTRTMPHRAKRDSSRKASSR